MAFSLAPAARHRFTAVELRTPQRVAARARGVMLLVVCAFALTCSPGPAGVGAAEPFDAGPSVTGTIELRAGERVESMSLRELEGASVVSSAIPGVTIRVLRDGQGRGIDVRVLSLRPRSSEPLRVHARAVIEGWGEGVPVRDWVPTREGASAGGPLFVPRDWALDIARGLFDLDSQRRIALPIDRSLRVTRATESTGSRPARPSEYALQVEGVIRSGREVSVWACRDVGEPIATVGPRPPGPVSPVRGGVLFDGGESTDTILALVDAWRDRLGGARFAVEIGDGWLGRDRRLRESPRDWFDPRPGPHPAGIRALVAALRERGHPVGVWLVPHGFRASVEGEGDAAAFVTDSDGGPVSGGFIGPRVVDPTAEDGLAHLARLVRYFRELEVDYLRLGGLGFAARYYDLHLESLANPPRDPGAAFRASLAGLDRAAQGALALLGDAGTPDAALPFLDASRPTWDSSRRADALLQEATQSVRAPFLGSPLARFEAFPIRRGQVGERREERVLLAALSGRGIFASASELQRDARLLERFEDGYPPPDVLPVTTTPLEPASRASAWVRAAGTVEQPGWSVGVAHFGAAPAGRVRLSSLDLGARRGVRVAVFSTRDSKIIFRGRLAFEHVALPGTFDLWRVVPLRPRPQLLATRLGSSWSSRRSSASWDPTRGRLSGLVRSTPSRDASTSFSPVQLIIETPANWRPVRCSHGYFNSRGDGSVALQLPGGPSRTTDWSIDFESVDPARVPEWPLAAGFEGRVDSAHRAPWLEWSPGPSRRDASGVFFVFRDGELLARVPGSKFLDRSAVEGALHRYVVVAAEAARFADDGSVEAVPDESSASERVARSVEIELSSPRELHLDAVFASRVGSGPVPVVWRETPAGTPLRHDGQVFLRGLGFLAPQTADYRLDGRYGEFEARVGVDDAALLEGSAVFIVRTDGEEVFRSERLDRTSGLRSVRVSVVGAQTLTLEVEGGGSARDFANWIDPVVRVASARTDS